MKSFLKTDEKGNMRFVNENNKLHRDDGPAIILINGFKYWYKNGLLHRTDGPAVEYEDGTKSWYFEGDRHCECGPAIVRPKNNNTFEYKWYLQGLQYSKSDYDKISIKRNLKKLLTI